MTPDTRTQVALVSMPWASPSQTSLQLGILKAALSASGVSSTSIHLFLDFARLIGFARYEKLTTRPSLGFFCEWLFSRCLFDHQNGEEYLRYVEKRTSQAASRFATAAEPNGLLAIFGSGYERSAAKIRHGVVPRYLAASARRVLSTLREEGPCVVGFTCVFNQLVPSLALARTIKSLDPRVVVVLGGSAVHSPMGAECLRSFAFVDYIVDGEGERTLPELIAALDTVSRQGASSEVEPLGIYRRLPSTGEIVHTGPRPRLDMLDESPVPDYDDYFMDAARVRELDRSEAILRIEGSRGCWWGQKSHCTFCGVNGDSLLFRPKSPERVVFEVAYLSARYRSRHLYFVDAVTTPGMLRDVLPTIATHGFTYDLFMETRVTLGRRELQMMRDAGLRVVQPGIESFSTDVLRLMKKGTTMLHNIQFLKWCREYGIGALYHILWGFPGERPEAYEEMARCLRSLVHLTPPDYPPRMVSYQRYSPLFAHASSAGTLHPRGDYSFIFPQEVDLGKLAFAFEHPLEGQWGETTYISDVAENVLEWRRRYYSLDRPMLAYAAGPQFVEVWDSRFGSLVKLMLTGASAAILIYCDSIQTREALEEHVRAECGKDYTSEELDGILSQLVEKRLVAEENGKYLALPISRAAVAGELQIAAESVSDDERGNRF